MRPFRTSLFYACLALAIFGLAGCSFRPNPISVSSLTVDFSGTPVRVGETATMTLTVTNSGHSPLSLTFKINGVNSGDFQIVSPSGSAQVSSAARAMNYLSPRAGNPLSAADITSTPCAVAGTAVLNAGTNCTVSVLFQP